MTQSSLQIELLYSSSRKRKLGKRLKRPSEKLSRLCRLEKGIMKIEPAKTNFADKESKKRKNAFF